MSTALLQLEEIFRTVLDLPADADVRQASPRTIAAWDSLAHVSLVAAIESEFDVVLDPEEALAMTSFAETAALLRRRLD